MDYVKYRLVNNDFAEDVVVHVDYEQHRLVTIDLQVVVAVHVGYPVDHRLAGHDSPRRGRIVVHLD